jgi:ribonuclease R
LSRGRERPERVVAEVSARGRVRSAEPLFERGPRSALVRESIRCEPGDIVLAEIDRGGARATRRLGAVGSAADVAAALLWEGERDRGFAPGLEADAREQAARGAEAAAQRSALGDGPARRDLTELDTLTVDPASAHDFDDAISASRDGDEIRLWIHIADVAAFVRPASGLDREALERGTSTYVPGTVEPMLPLELSAGACSLSPGGERLAVTTEIVLGPQGQIRSASFYRSVVRSDARLDYDHLDAVFGGRERAPQRVAEPLELARRAAAALRGSRRGSALEVSSSEPEFEFDRSGAVTGARSVPQTEAHGLIEQLMIATNERVAELSVNRRLATIYRVHEQPDPPRVRLLVEQLAALDLPAPALPDELGPSAAAEAVAEASRLVVREAERRGQAPDVFSSLVLRSLKQAHYSDRNLGHAGLGSSAYAHFTSPIRRYPDLVAHRALLSALGAGEDEPERSAVAEAAVRSSEREREALATERRADKACAAFLLERELYGSGWETAFDGEVSGLVGGGAFVRFAGELADVYEGFLPARTIQRDRYELDATETSLIGQSSGRRVRFGDPVRVRVRGIEAPRGRVDLLPVRDDGGRRQTDG